MEKVIIRQNNPKISILLSVFNGEKYICESINSILDQIYKNYELIIIDDGSTDNTIELIKSYDDDRIIFLKNNINLGLTQSLNIGLDHCNGDYIARLDVGDIMAKKRLDKQLKYLELHSNIAVVGSYFTCIDDIGNKIGEIKWPVGIKYNIFRSFYGENPVGHPGVLMRKDVILKLGKYREKFDFSQDIDLWLRMYSMGYLIDNIPEKLTHYRVIKNSISTMYNSKQQFYQRLAFYDYYNKLTGFVSESKIINSYLDLLLYKSKKINYEDIKFIMSIFSTLHYRFNKTLNLPFDNQYYYSLLGNNFNLNKYLNFHIYKNCWIFFPSIMKKIFAIK